MKIFFFIIIFFFLYLSSILNFDRISQDYIFKIESGDNYSNIKDKISKKDISFINLIDFIFFITGKDQNLRIGEYYFQKGENSLQIAFKILFDKVYYRSLYIPEGSKSLDFLSIKQIEKFCRYKNIENCNLDGFFHPNTYKYEFFENFNEVLNRSFNTQLSLLDSLIDQNRDISDYTSMELLIIASIIEKESCKNEMSKVAGVIYNRLAKKMKLQIDSTVIYGIKSFDGNLTKKHLKTDTPYNSYTNNGLPPTPISNPSLEAIQASIFPDDHEYLYFVKKEKCLHEFSTNYQDHLIAVKKYQLGK